MYKYICTHTHTHTHIYSVNWINFHVVLVPEIRVHNEIKNHIDTVYDA